MLENANVLHRMIRDERDPRHASKAHLFDIDDAELADM